MRWLIFFMSALRMYVCVWLVDLITRPIAWGCCPRARATIPWLQNFCVVWTGLARHIRKNATWEEKNSNLNHLCVRVTFYFKCTLCLPFSCLCLSPERGFGDFLQKAVSTFLWFCMTLQWSTVCSLQLFRKDYFRVFHFCCAMANGVLLWTF